MIRRTASSESKLLDSTSYFCSADTLPMTVETIEVGFETLSDSMRVRLPFQSDILPDGDDGGYDIMNARMQIVPVTHNG